jgi:nicotinamidase-related amidase
MKRLPSFISWTLLLALFFLPFDGLANDIPLRLTLRSRVKVAGKGEYVVQEQTVTWNPRKTAIIICDMWDAHWCKSAAARVAELAGPMNKVIQTARGRGVFVIHAPSSVTSFYNDTPQRKGAISAPFATAPVPLSTSPRWGTAWCWPDAAREAVLPIDDSDMGCDCPVKCRICSPWTRQTAAIEIAEPDAITDNGQETWNLLAERGIEHVAICGVHLNMCVLGRPFGIRQMVRLGKQVALMRDMTDTMYNPDRPPGVSHLRGTELVVEHVEKYWCPTFLSSDITGQPAFRFTAAGGDGGRHALLHLHVDDEPRRILCAGGRSRYPRELSTANYNY